MVHDQPSRNHQSLPNTSSNIIFNEKQPKGIPNGMPFFIYKIKEKSYDFSFKSTIQLIILLAPFAKAQQTCQSQAH